MPNDRIDLYTNFHKGIRKLLFELLIDAGKTDFRDGENSRKICEELSVALEMLNEHGRIEDEVFHPAMNARAPGATRDLDEQHRFEQELIDGLAEQVERLRDAPASERNALGLHLYRTLGMFSASYLDHLAAEEQELLPRFWEHFSDDELLDLRRQAETRLDARQLTRWLRVVVPALDAQEQAALMGGVKARAPESFEHAAEQVRQVMLEEDWKALAQSIGVD